MKLPLHRHSATQLVRMLAAREVSCEAVTHSFLDAIGQRENDVRAFTWFEPEHALKAARHRDITPSRGPLHGLPIAVKDFIDTADVPTEYGSPIYAGRVPHVDAACVAAARVAGAHLLGKTVTAELANFTPGATRNPHALDHTPGGSSSGSAAAVAAHMAPLALGTQTAGSVIRPASFCGVVGFVPTRGSIPRAGVKPVSDTLDVVGCFANTVDDVALLSTALTPGAQPDLPTLAQTDAPMAVAWTATPWAQQLAPEMIAALHRVVQRCELSGAAMREVVWREPFVGLADAHRTVQVFETARALGTEYDRSHDLLSAQLAALIEEGRAIEPGPYMRALQTGRNCAGALDRLLGDAGVVLAPSAAGAAPAGLHSTGSPQFNRAWHLLGGPQISLPVPRAMRGDCDLPLGVQLIGRAGDDARVLAAARWLESLMGAGV